MVGRTWCGFRAGKPALEVGEGIDQLGGLEGAIAPPDVVLAKNARVGEPGMAGLWPVRYADQRGSS